MSGLAWRVPALRIICAWHAMASIFCNMGSWAIRLRAAIARKACEIPWLYLRALIGCIALTILAHIIILPQIVLAFLFATAYTANTVGSFVFSLLFAFLTWQTFFLEAFIEGRVRNCAAILLLANASRTKTNHALRCACAGSPKASVRCCRCVVCAYYHWITHS